MSIDMFGDKELIHYLDNLSRHTKSSVVKGLREVGQHLEKEVKSKFGTYQKGWPKLKRETVKAKYRQRSLSAWRSGAIKTLAEAFNSTIGNDDPLILHGKLRDSIENEVYDSELTTLVYSDVEYAAVHEYGFAKKNVPARSFMRLTLWDEEEKVVELINARLEIIIGGSNG